MKKFKTKLEKTKEEKKAQIIAFEWFSLIIGTILAFMIIAFIKSIK